MSAAGAGLSAMTETSIVTETERELRALATTLTTPRAGECLLCFVARMLTLGCDNGLRWATRYRDLCAPMATGLERRLGQVGGYCDCEILVNGYELRDGVPRPEDPDRSDPDPWPTCRGVRRGSTRGCDLWVRVRRW